MKARWIYYFLALVLVIAGSWLIVDEYSGKLLIGIFLLMWADNMTKRVFRRR